jgi:hypothetical protein
VAQIEDDKREGYPYTYVEKHWDDMYLDLRCPLPINVSPGFSYRDDATIVNTPNAQSRRVARFVSSFFRFQKNLIEGGLEPELVPVPQCMYQFGRSECHDVRFADKRRSH